MTHTSLHTYSCGKEMFLIMFDFEVFYGVIGNVIGNINYELILGNIYLQCIDALDADI